MSIELKAAIDGFAEDLTPDTAADYVVTKDTSANALKRVKPSNLFSGYQPLDSDLTAIAALTPSSDDVVQRKGGAWTNRTLAQVKTDLSLPSDTVTSLAGKVNNTGNESIAGTKTFSNGIIVATRLRRSTTTALTPGATPSLDCSLGDVFTLTPAQDETIAATNQAVGQEVWLIVLTSGVTTYTLTFGTGFKTTGTLATGGTSAKYFVLQFFSDGTNLYEVSRTVAM